MTRVLAIALGLSLATTATAQDGGARDAGIRDAGVPDSGAGDAAASVDGGAEIELPEGHIPRIEVALEPRDTIRTGDVVRLILTVDAVEGDDVTVPAQSFTPLELHRRSASERSETTRICDSA